MPVATSTKLNLAAAPTPSATLTPPVVVFELSTGTVLTVGAGMEFATLGAACRAALGGDTIAVRAGTYTNDFATVRCDLKIISVGGTVNEVATTPPPNDKGLLTVDANLSIQGFSFTGGSDGSPDGNVSGIRLESGNLNVNYCYFHNMQEGLLADPDPTATVVINHSEFADNGTGDGYTHNVYVGSVASALIENSTFTGANVGHEIKSRAMSTTITNNTIVDGPTGTASYDIDIPNGGVAVISNNLIEKGPDASNWPAIHYGGETQYAYANNSLSITGNTILNDLGANAIGVLNQSAVNGLTVSAQVSNNYFYGFDPTRLVMGGGTLSNNTTLAIEPTYVVTNPSQAVPLDTIAPGPALLNLVNGGNAVSGGTSRLTVNDTAGSNSITGGAGGINVTASAGWDTIVTQAGATDTITLSGRNSVLNSAGADRIDASSYYEAITATGAATITGAGFNAYTLDGAGEKLTASVSGNVTVGSAGNAQIVDLGGDLALTLAAGGRVVVSDQADTPQGGASTATIQSGAATGQIGNSGLISITTGPAGAAVVAGTGRVSITGGTGADTLFGGSGTDTFSLGGGADRVTFGSGTTSVTGGTGTDTYVFASGAAGTATITGFKQGTDQLKYTGFVGPAVSSGTIVGGNTLLTLSDGTTVDLVGVALPGYSAAPSAPATSSGGTSSGAQPASGNGTLVLTTGGNVIPAGTASTVVDLAGYNTITGSAGGFAANVEANDVLTTAQGSTDQLNLSRWDTLTGAGNDQVAVSAYGNVISEAGAANVTLAGAGNVVHGGAGLLSISDQVGGDTVGGGAGGVVASLAGMYDSVTTQAGAADTVSLAGQSTLASNGADRIAVQGLYDQVSVTGAASVTAAAGSYASFVLDGADSLTSAGGGSVTVGSAASVAFASAGGNDFGVVKLAGGVVSASESLPGGVASLAVSGGAATISAAAGYYAGLSATLGSGDTVSAGSGNVTLTGGAGQDSFAGGAGNALVTLGNDDTVSLGSGALTVQGGAADLFVVPQGAVGSLTVVNWSAQDGFATPGQGSTVFSNESVSGGNLWLTTSGGAHVELVGVTHR